MRSKWTKLSLSVPGTILEYCMNIRILCENISMSDERDRKLKKQIFVQKRVLSKISSSR